MAGQQRRTGLSLAQLFQRFPDDAAAEQWFINNRWPDGVQCPRCESDNIHRRPKQTARTSRRMPFRCRTCQRDFSVKTGSIMEHSRLGYQVWVIALYQLTTGIKGVSSMKLHRDLGITQKSAWHLAHRIREAWADQPPPFFGPVEVDETYVGGRNKNRHANKKVRAASGRPASGTLGKIAVVGMKDRLTRQVTAQVVDKTDRPTLSGYVYQHTLFGAQVYTDEHSGYDWVRNRQVVKHSVGQYVNGQVSTNGIESFWATLKRGYMGTYHKMSKKHLQRYVNEFVGRHNQRPLDTLDQMEDMAVSLLDRRLSWADLTR